MGEYARKPLPAHSKPLPPMNQQHGQHQYGQNQVNLQQKQQRPQQIHQDQSAQPHKRVFAKSKPDIKTERGRPIGSLFKGTDLLKVDFTLPDNADRETLRELREQINNLYDADVTALEEFYDDQLRRIDERL